MGGLLARQREQCPCACAQPLAGPSGRRAALRPAVSLGIKHCVPRQTAHRTRPARPQGSLLHTAVGPGHVQAGRPRAGTLWLADHRLSSPDALHPQPAVHTVTRAAPGGRRGGHDAAGVSGGGGSVSGHRLPPGCPSPPGTFSEPASSPVRRGSGSVKKAQ